jgi:hypothetical protein
MASWQPLKSRTLKLGKWSEQLALSRVDPYLVWADSTDFVGFVGGPSANIQIAFEIESGIPNALDAMTSCGGQAVLVSQNFGVASMPLDGLSCLMKPSMQTLIPRFEIGLPLAGDPSAYPSGLLGNIELDIFTSIETVPAMPVAAVIDHGCPFAHESFRTRWTDGSWHTRLGALWFQEDRNAWGFDAATLNGWLATNTRADGSIDEGACYRAQRDEFRRRLLPLPRPNPPPDAAELWWRRINASAMHGAHVLDVMAGSPNPLAVRHRWGTAKDAAAAAPLLFVQLPRETVDDTSGLSMNVCVLEALAYIAARTQKRKVCVNLSYGSLAGPHDGSSLLECAIDEFLRTYRPRIELVLPVGNGYDSRTHASATLAPDGQWLDLPLHLLPNDPTDTFVELWYDASANRPTLIDVALIGPDGTDSGAVECDTAIECTRAGARLPSMAIVHQSRPPVSAGSSRRCALIAFAATKSRTPLRPIAAHGVWALRVRNRGPIAVRVDAWIERDDSNFGSGRSRSQATFLSDGTPPARGAAHGATPPIDRRACLNSIAHGALPTVIGGIVKSTGQLASYSASGPGRCGPWPGPRYVAPCESHPGVGLLAAGTRSGSVVPMNGTSVASAAAARVLYNCLALGSDPPRVKPVDLPDFGKDPLHPTPDPALRRGEGELMP